MGETRVLIMGAAGRDFHNFNVFYRNSSQHRVVGFTATQIPDIDGRVYPESLAGERYPEGIPIFAEEEISDLVARLAVDEVVFAYSDVTHAYVMHRASLALARGADFRLLGPKGTMIKSTRPVVSVCAVRTGCGKSQTTRAVVGVLKEMGIRPVVIRHPMPYGDLAKQACQRFADLGDLDRHECTIEEREEYEPHIEEDTVVYAGVDYEQILRRAEQEADVVIWDGGNNDLPFYVPDLHIVVCDPLRPGHELNYHPGEANLRMADAAVINKVDSAEPGAVAEVRENIRRLNPGATIVEADSPITVEDEAGIRGKRVLVVEDGPTLTHGEMSYGAGVVAARRAGAAELVDPRPFAVGTIKDTFEKYPHVGALLPAMGYGEGQIRDLERTINASGCDVVLMATPIDLRRVARLDPPAVRAAYRLAERGEPGLSTIIRQRLGGAG